MKVHGLKWLLNSLDLITVGVQVPHVLRLHSMCSLALLDTVVLSLSVGVQLSGRFGFPCSLCLSAVDERGKKRLGCLGCVYILLYGLDHVFS